ncbi:membrane-bound lytic murein transglycosylase B [Candidatus Magnetomoraceae bacterium gMMP-15]
MLEKRLIQDGFDKDMISALYSNPKAFFDVNSVSGYFRHNEATLNYKQFESKKSIYNAKMYMNQHAKTLAKVEKSYGVPKEIITAILLVETRLGKFTGNSSVFNTLSTMAALKNILVRDKLWSDIPKQRRVSRDQFNKTSQKKSDWAYNELKAYLQYVTQEKFKFLKILNIRGSYAGAMGMSQFIPSSILKYAKDGNGDGKINLFEHKDAIESIANYLKAFDWYPGIKKDKAFEVIYNYNHSDYYVNTILRIAELLKG